MKILTLSIFLLLAGKMEAQQNVENPALKEQIRKLDLAHAQAILDGNAVALDTLMNDDVTVNHPTNRIVKEKKELLDLIKKGTIRYTRFERSPETFLFYEKMVVVMGSEVVIPAQGAPNAGKIVKRRYTNVWMKHNERWQLAVRHANNVCAN